MDLCGFYRAHDQVYWTAKSNDSRTTTSTTSPWKNKRKSIYKPAKKKKKSIPKITKIQYADDNLFVPKADIVGEDKKLKPYNGRAGS